VGVGGSGKGGGVRGRKAAVIHTLNVQDEVNTQGNTENWECGD